MVVIGYLCELLYNLIYEAFAAKGQAREAVPCLPSTLQGCKEYLAECDVARHTQPLHKSTLCLIYPC